MEITEEIKERVKHGHKCFDCGGYSEWYAIHDTLWITAWPTYLRDRAQLKEAFLVEGYKDRFWLLLCLSCVAGRLHRPLTINDFNHSHINEPIRFGYFLGQKSMG